MDFITSMTLGTAMMLVIAVIGAKKLQIPYWKATVITLGLVCAGYAGARWMFWLESGTWDKGRSFFGAVFLAPPLMALLSLLLRVPIGKTLDICAPSECVMLAVLKVNCLMEGCCGGKTFCINEAGKVLRFPSQAVECAHALLLAAVLLYMILRNSKRRGFIYPWYLVLYGAGRFVLNLLRDTTPFFWILPAGNLWALVSLAVGALWIGIMRNRKNTERGN